MKLTLGKKLGLGFGVILALMVLTTSLTYIESANIKRTQDAILDVRVPSLEVGRRLQRDLNQTASKTRQGILAGTQPARRQEAKQMLDAAWGEVDKDIAKMDELSPNWLLQENRDRLAEIKRQVPILKEVEETSINLASSGDREALVKGGDWISDRASWSTTASRSPLETW